MIKYNCPCCNSLTLTEKPPGTFEICPVCYWEDDNIQYNDPEFKGGANDVSLKEAKQNFLEFKASDKKFINLVRNPLDIEIS